MSIQSRAEFEALLRVGRIVARTLGVLARHVRPGVTTGELDRIGADLFARHGARSAPAMVYGFPRTVLISVNDEAVHGIPGPRRLAAGDVVKLDVTAEKDGYMADAARTVLIGPASAEARRLRACARAAFTAALRVARAGTPVREVARVIETTVHRRGFSVVEGLGGHGIGRTIHEPPSVPNRHDPNQRDVLTEGLVLTIEPIVCAGSGDARCDPDGWTIRTRDGSLAAHHEHTLVITRRQPIVLTAAA